MWQRRNAKRETPEKKTRPPAATSGAVLTRENPGSHPLRESNPVRLVGSRYTNIDETVRIPRAKKRSRVCENDERHIAKVNRNSGQAYTDRSVEVCELFFLKTYSLSDGRVSRALKKYREGKAPCEDLRGRKPNPIKISPQTRRKDTCKTSDLYNIKKKDPNLTQGEKLEMETSHELHLRKAEKAQECMKRQNRNMNVALTLLRYVHSDNNSIETIERKFLVSGHSYLPNDGDFGCVETASKNRTLYVPKDWVQFRRNKMFVVHGIQCSDIVSVKRLQICNTRRRINLLADVWENKSCP
ncbi:hypothetical protein PR048_025453 [Dryococelus australis]|uniref:Uncharacterized protein n=1 Tax=Dryococelus australis TaxID=614101 RepID=A0ABQ9GRD0_9NEOP|nr:hypothetical protein PR048_025453 [Dryococelus australis]